MTDPRAVLVQGRPRLEDIVLPPGPGELRGWGHLRWIMREHPVKNLELLMAGGFIAIGLWLIWPQHEFPTGGVIYIKYGRTWSLVWSVFFILVGVAKIHVVGWRYTPMCRLCAATLASFAISNLFLAYLALARDHVMVIIGFLGLVAQMWIALKVRQVWRRQGK